MAIKGRTADDVVMERMIDAMQDTLRRRARDEEHRPLSRLDCAAALGAALLTMRQMTDWERPLVEFGTNSVRQDVA